MDKSWEYANISSRKGSSGTAMIAGLETVSTMQ